MNIIRNLCAPGFTSDAGRRSEDRRIQALRNLGYILSLEEDNRQIVYAFDSGCIYGLGDPPPSLLGHVSNALNMTAAENLSRKNLLNEICRDIQYAFDEDKANAFRSKFYSHLMTSTTPTKQELVDFFTEQQIMNRLSPDLMPLQDVSAEIVHTDASGFVADAHINESSAEPAPVEATLIDDIPPLTVAVPINDQASPNFGHNPPPDLPPLPVVEIDASQIVTDA
ncbi:MAG: hypothetical protein ACOYK6_08520 [Chthoniobacterales bacterium]